MEKIFDTKRTNRYLSWLIAPIILVYLAYASIYIWKTSFVANGERYFVLFDDAMISMRYAQNLANGYGAVWNAGQAPVEGFSNPLWVGLMAFFHLLPIPGSKISLAVQISGALFIAATLFIVKKIADEVTDQPTVGLIAAGMTAFYVPLHNWALQGMEVSALVLVVSLASLFAIRQLKSSQFSLWMYILLGVSTLIRIDMFVLFGVIWLAFVLLDGNNRRRHLIWGFGTLLVFLLGQTLLRFWYFGDALPNTYYLKMSGVPVWFRAAHGLYVFWQMLWMTNWLLYLVPFVVAIYWRDRYCLLLLTIWVAFSVYSIYVGGDAWEHRGGSNRFIANAMPIFFVVFVYAVDKIRSVLISAAGNWEKLGLDLAAAAFFAISLVSFNTMQDANALERFFFRVQPLFVKGSQRYTEMGLMIKEMTTEQASVAVVTAGAIPYFSERPAIDLMGKSDPVIAHQKMRVNLSRYGIVNFRPGHSKWDYAYSIGELKPDVIAQLWEETQEEANPYLSGDYTQVVIDEIPYYLRNDSPNILWDRVNELQP